MYPITLGNLRNSSKEVEFMKRVPFFASILCIFLMQGVAFASGVLVDTKGKVDVTLPGQSPGPVKIGAELPDGSTIAVGAGGAASVMLGSGAIIRLPSGSTYKVGAEVKGAKRTDLVGGLAIAMRDLAAAGGGPTVHGMVKKGKGGGGKIPLLEGLSNGLNAIYPSGTSIRLGSQLTFKWEATPAIDWTRPTLVIDDSGKRHIAVRPIPAGAHELTVDTSAAGIKKGGEYSWYLATEETSLKGKTRRFEFRTLSGEEEKRLGADIAKIKSLGMSDDGRLLLTGQLYFGMKMNYEASTTLEPLWQKSNPPFVSKLLWLAYSRMGRAAEAARFANP